MALQNIHIWSDGNIKTLWRLFGNYSVGISHVTTTNFTEMASSSAWNTSVPQISMSQFVLLFYPFLVWTFRFQCDKRCFSYENPFVIFLANLFLRPSIWIGVRRSGISLEMAELINGMDDNYQYWMFFVVFLKSSIERVLISPCINSIRSPSRNLSVYSGPDNF